MNKRMLYWWGLLLGVFIIHNLEELIFDMYEWEQTHDLPSWAERGRRFHESIQLTSFKFVFIIIAICVMVVAVAYTLRNLHFFSRIWMTFFIVVMLLVYLGHLATSLYVGSAMPGVYSSMLPGLPVYSLVLYKLWKQKKKCHT